MPAKFFLIWEEGINWLVRSEALMSNVLVVWVECKVTYVEEALALARLTEEVPGAAAVLPRFCQRRRKSRKVKRSDITYVICEGRQTGCLERIGNVILGRKCGGAQMVL